MASSTKRWPGDVDETFPDVFNINAMPPQPSEKKPGQLPENMIRQFFEEVRYGKGFCLSYLLKLTCVEIILPS